MRQTDDLFRKKENENISKVHQSLTLELQKSLERRVMSVTTDISLATLEVFDAAALVTLNCGSFSEGSVKLNATDGMYESYGVKECKSVLVTASNKTHIKQSGMDFDPRWLHGLRHRYMACIKEVCPEWFILEGEDNSRLHPQDSELVRFLVMSSDCLDALFQFKFASRKIFDVRKMSTLLINRFTPMKKFVALLKPTSCAITDVVLSKGGPEEIAESYYSAMRAQQQSGGQSNETLARQTKLS